MQEIENHNADGLCCEEFCSEKPTHFTRVDMNGSRVILAFCKKHAEEYEKNFSE